MENEGMGAQTLSTEGTSTQTLSTVDEKFTIVLGEASSSSTLTHTSNSIKLPSALYRTLRNEYVVKKTPACHDGFGLVLCLVYMTTFLSTLYIYVNTCF